MADLPERKLGCIKIAQYIQPLRLYLLFQIVHIVVLRDGHFKDALFAPHDTPET